VRKLTGTASLVLCWDQAASHGIGPWLWRISGAPERELAHAPIRFSSVAGLVPTPALSSNAGVGGYNAKSLKINKRCNAGVARRGLQNRGLQVRFLPGLLKDQASSCL